MENASLVMQGAISSMKQDGFDLNAMPHTQIANLLLDRLEGSGFLVVSAPVKRKELPAPLPSYIGKNHVAVMALMMKHDKQYLDIGNVRVRWGIPVDEEGDIEYLERLGYAERHPIMRCDARVTDQGRRVVEQARANGFKPEPGWPMWAR